MKLPQVAVQRNRDTNVHQQRWQAEEFPGYFVRDTTDNNELHKMELGAEVLRAGGSIRLKVLGLSMLPSVWPGDIVSVEGGSMDAIAPGDVVLYSRDDRFFIHRVIETSESGFIIRGDAAPQSDPAIARSHVLGRVSGIRRNGKTITPKPGLAGVMRILGWILCYCDSLRSAVLRMQSMPNTTS